MLSFRRSLIVLLTTEFLCADVPLQTFEDGMPGSSPSGWSIAGTSAASGVRPVRLSNLEAVTGSQSAMLESPLSGEVTLSRPVIFDGATPAFYDFWIKPVARSFSVTSGESGVVYVDGAQFLFQRWNGSRYRILALTVQDGAEVWRQIGWSAQTFELEDSSNLAKDWLRLTIRSDRSTIPNGYDVWINGRLAASDLSLVPTAGEPEFRVTNRVPPMGGGAAAPVYFDDFQATMTNPLYEDSDSDGLPNLWEVAYAATGLPAAAMAVGRMDDPDADGLSNIREYLLGSRPVAMDSDGDSMPDGWEAEYGLDPSNSADASLDMDGDGFSNLEERSGAGNQHPTLAPTAALPGIVYVRKGSNTPGIDGSYGRPHPTIQAAMAAVATGGCIVLLGEGGALEGPGNRNLSISKSLTIRGVNSAVVNLAAIAPDSSPAGRFGSISIPGGSTAVPAFTCENVIFQGGQADDGGAIAIYYTSAPVVFRQCRFESNHSTDDGAAIYGFAASLLIEDCWFKGNQADGEGGAINLEGGGAASVFRRSFFMQNQSLTDGGAVNLRSGSATLESCLISANGARRNGAGLAVVDSGGARLLQCTLSANVAANPTSSPVSGGGVYGSSNSGITVSGSILWGNAPGQLTGGTQAVSYSTIQAWNGGGPGNNAIDPVLRTDTGEPLASSMVDTGDPANNLVTDILGHARWDTPNVGSAIADRGAHERSIDTDGDGLSDNWEQLNSLNSNDPTDANADADQDAYSNLEEYQAKTLPRDAGSKPAPVIWVNPVAGVDYDPSPPPGLPNPIPFALQGDFQHPFRTIRRAILACGLGRRIALLDGRYTGSANINLQYTELWNWTAGDSGRSVSSSLSLADKTVRGVNGPSRVTLDAQHQGRLFTLSMGPAPVTLQNLTLRDGNAPAGEAGGGIHAYAKVSPGSTAPLLSIVNCVIAGCVSGTEGGGIHVTAASLSMLQCTISGCDAVRGGGVAAVGVYYPNSIAVSRSRIAYNTAQSPSVLGHDGCGGGVFLSTAYATFPDSRIDSNQASRFGGGVCAVGSGGIFSGSSAIVENNLAGLQGGGLYAESGAVHFSKATYSGNIAGTTGAAGLGGGLCLVRTATGFNYTPYPWTTPLISSEITGSTVQGNLAGATGGGLYIADASQRFTNCAFADNEVAPTSAFGNGGGIAVAWERPHPTNPEIPASAAVSSFTHCTVARNRSSASGPGLWAQLPLAPAFTNSILWFNPGLGAEISGSPSLKGSNVSQGVPLGTAAQNVSVAPNLAFDFIHFAVNAAIADPSGGLAAFRAPTDIDAEARPGTGYVHRGTDHFTDTDADGTPDWFEKLAMNFSMLDTIRSLADVTGSTDADGDGFTVLQELRNGGRPDRFENQSTGSDYDHDGLSDIFERMSASGLQWDIADTDRDGLSDGWEVSYEERGFHPNDVARPDDFAADADGDGLANLVESIYGLDPASRDTDRDGAADDIELAFGTDPTSKTSKPGGLPVPDSDGDGVDDEWEVALGLNPAVRDSDKNGTADGDENHDGDGVINRLDANPVVAAIDWSRTPEPRYIVHFLGAEGAPSAEIEACDLNNMGAVAGLAAPLSADPTKPDHRIPVIWRNGSWTALIADIDLPGAAKLPPLSGTRYQTVNGRAFASLGQSAISVFTSLGGTPIAINDAGTVVSTASFQIKDYGRTLGQSSPGYQNYTNAPSQPVSLVWPGQGSGQPATQPSVVGWRSNSYFSANDQVTRFDEIPVHTALAQSGLIASAVNPVGYFGVGEYFAPDYHHEGTHIVPSGTSATEAHGFSTNGYACGWAIPEGMFWPRAAVWGPLGSPPILSWLPTLSEAAGATTVEHMPSTSGAPLQGPLAIVTSDGKLHVGKNIGFTPLNLFVPPPSLQIWRDSEAKARLNTRGEILLQPASEGFDYKGRYNHFAQTTVWRNGRVLDLNLLLSDPTLRVRDLIDINDHGVILAKVGAADRKSPERIAVLLPVEIVAHKRGTISAPGPAVPKGVGEYGYETVMMENADSEDNTSDKRDCDTPGNAVLTNDDDFVKVILRYPKNMKLPGASLVLLHDGMEVDATKKSPEEAVKTSGSSRLNFYRADGTRITDPSSELTIPDIANPPPNSYISKVLTDGEVTLFLEGADRFGDLERGNVVNLGGARLKWNFKVGGQSLSESLLVYRGGFLRYLQPRGEPGTIGQLEFWDGKGRIRHEYGGHGNEFKKDEIDLGVRIAIWLARSGKKRDGSQNGIRGLNYNITGGYGHIPPGWWWNYERFDFSGIQPNNWKETKSGVRLNQGGYCRWVQDDATTVADRYTNTYRYNPNNDNDRRIGSPGAQTIRFKFELKPLFPTTYQNRADIQMHPDGWKDGTAGCIGIQSYLGCQEVGAIMRRYRNLRIRVQIQ